jgi:DNA gyrase subunit B
VQASQARAAARKAADLTRRKSALENSPLPGKLADCSVQGPVADRDLRRRGRLRGRLGQAGPRPQHAGRLPLRGKILNVEKARIDRVLKNNEIQALITALGTGIRDEFDIEKARYHKVVLMTDADVDGAHIRTLVLTLLFREMPELIEAGYIYIAKPPLYKLKQGRNERYIEKESELEEVLLSDKFEKIRVHDRSGAGVQAHRGALAALHAAAEAVRGLGELAARRARPRAVRFLGEAGLLDDQAADLAAVVASLEKNDASRPHTTTIVEQDGEVLVVKAIERKTGLAQTHRLPRAMFDSNDYKQFIKVNTQLVELAGAPPFSVALADKSDEAYSFEALRTAVSRCRAAASTSSASRAWAR